MWTREKYREYTYKIKRMVIDHYSKGTNKCSVAGCDANFDALTLDHTLFNQKQIQDKYGIKSTHGGGFYSALKARGFPDDMGIVVKCMAHNRENKHPEMGIRSSLGLKQSRNHIDPYYVKKCGFCNILKYSIDFGLKFAAKDGLQNRCTECRSKESYSRRLQLKIKAYKIYGYFGNPYQMTFEHLDCNGYDHKRYLINKFNLKVNPAHLGNAFYAYIIKDYEEYGILWPNLIVIHENKNHESAKRCAELRRKKDWES